MGLLNAAIGKQIVAIMALQQFGKGKVLGIASNSLWKWRGKSEALKVVFGRIWRQSIRNITESAEGSGVISVRWDQDYYRPGEQAVARVRVAGNIQAGLKLSATLSKDGKAEPIPVDPVPGEENAYSLRLQFRERGEYTLYMAAYQERNILDSYEKTFQVASLLDEGTNLEMKGKFLRSLARRSSGMFGREDEADVFTGNLLAGLRHETVVSETPLVQTGPYFIILFILFLVTEWISRRRKNLV